MLWILYERSHALKATEERSKTKRSTSFVSGRTIFISAVVLAMIMFIGEIVITNVAMMGIRAKFSEVPHNLEAIRTVEFAYHVQHGEFRSAEACPKGPPRRRKSAWKGECTEVFKNLGWTPDGSVQCQYRVRAILGENAVEDFKLTARCDVDGDGIFSIFEASRNSPPKRITSVNIYWYPNSLLHN